MSATRDDRGRIRDELLAEIVPRQPVLSIIHVITAFLFASSLSNAAPAPVLAAWFGYMVVSQAIRLILWFRHVAGRLSLDLGTWLVATSGAAGIGWGMAGALFSGLGTPPQQMLVPFFLAGMAAGAVANLAGHLLVLYAFIVPALLPYATRLALDGNPAARTMALTILAYAASLTAVAYQVHRSFRRSVELHLENARLVADLEQAQRGLERLVERRGAELDAVMQTVPVSGSRTTRTRVGSRAAAVPPRCCASGREPARP